MVSKAYKINQQSGLLFVIVGHNKNFYPMKNYLTQIFIFFIMLTTLTGCEIVGGIFEAGVWVGVILVVLVIAAVIWLIKKIL